MTTDQTTPAGSTTVAETVRWGRPWRGERAASKAQCRFLLDLVAQHPEQAQRAGIGSEERWHIRRGFLRSHEASRLIDWMRL